MKLGFLYWAGRLMLLGCFFVYFSIVGAVLIRFIQRHWSVGPRIVAMVQRLGTSAMVAVLFFIGGYASRDLKQYAHTDTYRNVTVLRKDAPNLYRMWSRERGEFEFKFCADYTPDFDEGSILRYISFEDRGKCKSISDTNFGFAVVRNEHGQPELLEANQ